MELTLKKGFDLSKNTLQHRIVLDAIELLKDKENCTTQEITSMVYLAILQNVCEEDVVELVSEEQNNIDFWTILETIIEPKVEEVLGENDSYLYDIVYDIQGYKEREIEINGKFFYAMRELIKQIGEFDTAQLSGILTSVKSLKQKTQEAITEEKSEEKITEANEKMQELISKFKTVK